MSTRRPTMSLWHLMVLITFIDLACPQAMHFMELAVNRTWISSHTPSTIHSVIQLWDLMTAYQDVVRRIETAHLVRTTAGVVPNESSIINFVTAFFKVRAYVWNWYVYQSVFFSIIADVFISVDQCKANITWRQGLLKAEEALEEASVWDKICKVYDSLQGNGYMLSSWTSRASICDVLAVIILCVLPELAGSLAQKLIPCSHFKFTSTNRQAIFFF